MQFNTKWWISHVITLLWHTETEVSICIQLKNCVPIIWYKVWLPREICMVDGACNRVNSTPILFAFLLDSLLDAKFINIRLDPYWWCKVHDINSFYQWPWMQRWLFNIFIRKITWPEKQTNSSIECSKYWLALSHDHPGNPQSYYTSHL